jgi:hypothetical protein
MSEKDPLQKHLEKLPREIAPERDLWPEIARRARPRRAWPARAAVIALGLAAAAALVLATRRRPEPTAPIASAPALTLTPIASASAPAIGPLPGEAEYASALASLEAELAQRRPEMPEHARAAIDEDLRVVDDAITSSREALAARPADPELRAELDRAYEDKLDLVREATELLTGI